MIRQSYAADPPGRKTPLPSRSSRRNGCTPNWDDSAAFLRSTRPPYEALRPQVRLVDLFCGCGGLSLGVAEAARANSLGIDIRLAVDADEDAVAVYGANFPQATVVQALVEDLFDGTIGAAPTRSERRIRRELKSIDVLVGGPPCQGHSDLNNHTRRSDPRNAIYARMARAAEIIRPQLVIIENVPTIQHDHEGVADITVNSLKNLGYTVTQKVTNMTSLGVPQRRRRHVVLASRLRGYNPQDVLHSLEANLEPARTVHWAIHDLLSVATQDRLDMGSKPTQKNLERMEWLINTKNYDLPNEMRPQCHHSDHSYSSMYGRLAWDEPAQTITTGFGSMGQGRYVHPARPRTLTPHEAARLQMIPDFWDLSEARTRTSLSRLIGNAVPPPLSCRLTETALRLLFGEVNADPHRPNPVPHRSVSRDPKSASIAKTKSKSKGPAPSSVSASKRFQSVRQANTSPEQLLRRELDRLRLSYQPDARPVNESGGRADILFVDEQIAIFVDGCFWHSCPDHATRPKANAKWWRAKLQANRKRDRKTDRLLRRRGWLVLRFWEHSDAARSAQEIRATLAHRRQLNST